MPYNFYPPPAIPVSAVAAAATGIDARKITSRVILFSIFSGTMTVQFQVSTDNANWFNVGSAVSTNGATVTVPDGWIYIRANTTASTGSGGAVLMGVIE